MSVNPEKSGSTGFTLIELSVTLAVFAIILLVAVPSFRDLLLNNRSVSQINDLVASLNYARSEAIKRGVEVAACSSTNGMACNNGANWSQGWIIGVTDTITAPALNPVLKVYPALKGNDRLTNNRGGEILYDRNGFASSTNSSFTLCPEDNDAHKIRAAAVALTGRIRLAEDSNGDGIVEDTDGDNYSCGAPPGS